VKVVEGKEQALLGALRSMLGISPKVTLKGPETIARSEGKAVRVVDKRKI
jgi:phenylacetate-CoA ligase